MAKENPALLAALQSASALATSQHETYVVQRAINEIGTPEGAIPIVGLPLLAALTEIRDVTCDTQEQGDAIQALIDAWFPTPAA